MQSNSQVPNINYSVANGGNSSGPFITILKTVDPNSNDIQYSVKQRWINTLDSTEWILTGFTSNSGVTNANWLQLSNGVSSLVLIQTLTASNSASLVFSTGISSTYDVYELKISRFVAATDAAFLTMQVSTDGGSSWENTGYFSGTIVNQYNSNALNNNNITTSFYLAPTLSNSSAVGTTSASFNIHNMGSANFMTIEGNMFVTVVGGGIYFGYFGGIAQHNSVNAIRLIMSAGNITSGVASLYGILK